LSRGLKDNSVHDHARAIRTLLIFWHDEGYIVQRVKFEMPKLFHKRLLVLTPEQLQVLLKACSVRDKAIVLLLVDSGLRRFETANLNRGDVDFHTGLVRVRSGKGRKDRSTVIGATTRRALLAYRRTLVHRDDRDPLIQSRDGQRLSGNALLTMCRRLTKRTGIKVTPHALRRTFAILSLRSGMSPLHLQALGGWEGFDMVKHYAQMVDDDLLQAHTEHSPIDNLGRLK
jgi:integrase/recombinase XerD